MTPPSESSSGHIDMFRVRRQRPGLPDRSLPPAAHVVPRHPRYHSVQLALVTGLFACGGLICSMLLVDSSEDFLRLHYWPRKSYSSPAPGTPQNPTSAAPAVPQSGSLGSNGEKNAVSQECRVGDRKASTSAVSLASAA